MADETQTRAKPGRRAIGRLRRVERLLETPMVVLAFVWIGLMVAEFAGMQSPWLERASTLIWLILIADFALRISLAERKRVFLRANVLTLVSLVLPAFRIFRLTRVLRLARATRGLRLVRLGTSVNRSMRALMHSMGNKGLGYVLAMTVIVTVAGAAGMLALEESLFTSYWHALWWTAMIVTTMGSEAWPLSLEGRVLCLTLAIYAFSIFGYVTAALASFLVERGKPAASNSPDEALISEMSVLRQEIARLSESINREH